MIRRPILIVALCTLLVAMAESLAAPAAPAAARSMIIVVGAPGEAEYEETFEREAQQWAAAAVAAGVAVRVVAPGDATNAARSQRAEFEAALDGEAAEGDDLWLVLIGHGTFDGREAKFNLQGPDLAAAELGGRLKRFERPIVVLGFFASSAPFLACASAPHHVVVAATRSAGERNYSRLGEFAAQALDAPDTDLDGDGVRSILEVVLAGARRPREFYEGAQRLATEHAMIDDDGDGVGTPAETFTGVRADAASGRDGERARVVALSRDPFEAKLGPDGRAARAAIERRIEELRARKASLPDSKYYLQLERLLLEMAAIYGSQ